MCIHQSANGHALQVYSLSVSQDGSRSQNQYQVCERTALEKSPSSNNSAKNNNNSTEREEKNNDFGRKQMFFNVRCAFGEIESGLPDAYACSVPNESSG